MPAAIGAGAGHPAVHWVFTLNNYSDDDVIRLCDERALLGAGVRYMVVGKEVGESGTPHLQGCVSFKNKLRMAAVKRIISELAHFEVCRAIPASREYCKKDGDYWTIGEDTVSAGKRSDLDDFKDAVKGGMLSIEEIRENHSEIYARYPRFVFDYIAANAPPIELPQHPLKPWQQELNDILIHEADTRTVNFVVDVRGNCGKSWFALYFASLHLRVQVMFQGRRLIWHTHWIKRFVYCLLTRHDPSKANLFSTTFWRTLRTVTFIRPSTSHDSNAWLSVMSLY